MKTPGEIIMDEIHGLKLRVLHIEQAITSLTNILEVYMACNGSKKPTKKKK